MSLSTMQHPAVRLTLAALAVLATAGACAAPTAPSRRQSTLEGRRVFFDAAPKDTTPRRDSTGVGTNGGGYILPDI